MKNLIFYIGMLLACSVLIYGIIKLGNRFETTFHAITQTENSSHFLSDGFSLFTHSLDNHIQTPIAMLLLQVIAILCTARIFGFLFVKIGQPSVVGEILAGIVLGPSVLAHFLP
ncbi:MAG: cation/H(+) antiporter, partial [Candidatus Symbiothrix sp.]|nr:cation/H(+) antiporter [Candidatus Symbiothrix sp.]